MPKSNHLADDTENLSRLLDEINLGRQPKTTDPETIELLEVATLIKSSSTPVKPPQHLIDQTVMLAMESLPPNKVKRYNKWLYSGALSTAAAILLIIGLHTIPSWQTETLTIPSQVSPDISNVPTETSLEKQSLATNSLPTQSVPSEPTQQNKSTNTSLERSIPTETKKNAPTSESKSSPSSSSLPTYQAPLISEFAQLKLTTENSAEDSTPIESMKNAPTYKSKRTAIEPLSLAGRSPDLIVSDTQKGIVRQIYAKDTPQQIIITQQIPSPPSLSDAKVAESTRMYLEKSVPPLEKATKTLNKITVIIQNQKVTLESNLSTEELTKLAESLSVSK